MSQSLDPDPLWGPLRPLADRIRQQRSHVRVAGAQFAVEQEVRLLGQVGRLQVVGPRQVVEVPDREVVVAGLEGQPGWVAEGGESRCPRRVLVPGRRWLIYLGW